MGPRISIAYARNWGSHSFLGRPRRPEWDSQLTIIGAASAVSEEAWQASSSIVSMLVMLETRTEYSSGENKVECYI